MSKDTARTPPVGAAAQQHSARLFTPRRFIAFGVIFLLVAFVVNFLSRTRLLEVLDTHNVDSCRHVGVDEVVQGGAEDMSFDHHNILFFSSETFAATAGGGLMTTEKDVLEKIANMTAKDQGAMFAYDGRAESSTFDQVKRLQITGLPAEIQDFHPHGVDIPRPPPDVADYESLPIYLYVLNHCRRGDEFIVFEVIYQRDVKNNNRVLFPPSLKYHTTIVPTPNYFGLNDLGALYPTRITSRTTGRTLLQHSFYASNFVSTRIGNTIMNLVEQIGGFKWATVVLCQQRIDLDGDEGSKETRCSTVISNVFGPNGVILSYDRKFLYVAYSFDTTVGIYDLAREDAKMGTDEWGYHDGIVLTHVNLNQTLTTNTALDNISIDPITGDLILGAHPVVLKSLAHVSDPKGEIKAPTQVIRVGMGGRGVEKKKVKGASSSFDDPLSKNSPLPFNTVHELHLSNGGIGRDGKFSAISVSVWNRESDEIILGSVKRPGILICPYPKEVRDLTPR